MTPAALAEAVLFVASEPVRVADMARAIQSDEAGALEAIAALQERLDTTGSGLLVVRISEGYQLATRAACRDAVGRLLARDAGKLSRAALETLAIVAYRQPTTQPEIEAVRGVGCGSVLRTLVDRNLVAEAGRKPTVGRPILYATTPSFLHYFALGDLSELPPLQDAHEGAAGQAHARLSGLELPKSDG
jgi:segregation and condensation protein B